MITPEGMFRWLDDDDRIWLVPLGMEPSNVGRCRGCKKLVLWVATKAGKKSPRNVDGTSHHATCPNADQFRGSAPDLPFRMPS